MPSCVLWVEVVVNSYNHYPTNNNDEQGDDLIPGHRLWPEIRDVVARAEVA